MFEEQDYPTTRFPNSSFIPPEGPIGADIMIIGDSPGSYEDMGEPIYDAGGDEIGKRYRPFIGPAGKMLDSFLKQAGLERKDIFLTYVVKRRPNEKNDLKTKEAELEIAANLPALYKEIRTVRPKVIVPMGNIALKALGFSWPIGNCRGFVFHSSYGKVIPTYHPGFVFKQFQEKITCQKDWQKIVRLSHTANMPQQHESFTLDPTIEDVESFSALVQAKVRSGQKVSVALDLETYYLNKGASPLNNPIKLVGLATSKSHAIVVPFIDQNDELYWTEDEEIRAWTAIGNILDNPGVEIMVHNAMFDILVLMNHGFDVRAKCYDTMIAQSLTYQPSKHTLEYLGSIYTDWQPWKLQQGRSDEGFRRYNALDTVILHHIRPQLEEDISDNRLGPICNIMMDEIKPVCHMMLRGLAIDQRAYNEVRKELEEKLEELTRKMRAIAGRVDFNPNSTAQVGDLLFKQLKLKSGVKTKGGKKSTDDAVLNRLFLRYPGNEAVQTLQEIRHYGQQYKIFIKNLYIHVDQRVHTEFKMHTVATGRFSSSNPNLMNLPARKDEDGFIRGLYRVKPGRMIATCDYSQLELMIFAELSGDEIWKAAFANDEDVHVINGKSLLKDYYDPKYRTFTKNFIYGFIYGSEGGDVEKVAPKELIEHISVPGMMENLREDHPWMFEYREEIEDQLYKRKYITNAFGRRRYWPTMHISNANKREAYNYPIQATAADIMHTRLPIMERELDPQRDWLVLQLHDAFYVETDESRYDTVLQIMKDIMEYPIETPMGYVFNLKADAEYGVSLSKKDLKKWNKGGGNGN